MTTNNHPENGPVSLDRLHQIREILSKAAAQRDGGNLGYAMTDAVKVIDGAIAAFDAKPVAIVEPSDYVTAAQLVGEEPRSKAVRPLFEGALAIGMELYAAPPAPVVPVVPDIDTIALNTARNIMCDINRMEGWPGGDIQLLACIQSRIEQTCRAVMLKGDAK